MHVAAVHGRIWRVIWRILVNSPAAHSLVRSLRSTAVNSSSLRLSCIIVTTCSVDVQLFVGPLICGVEVNVNVAPSNFRLQDHTSVLTTVPSAHEQHQPNSAFSLSCLGLCKVASTTSAD